MMESSRVCRLCSATIDSKRALSLFSTTGQRQKLASRISKLLDIPEPIPSDTLPSIICWKCNQRISTLEKALAELDRMKALARSSLEGRGMKRVKETSGAIGVSPDTLRQRPPAKLSRKKLMFESKLTPL